MVFGLFGVHSFIGAVVPHEAILGIIFVVGFSMVAQVIESVPRRWYPAVLVGMIIGVCDYAVAGLNSPNKDVVFLQNGYLFISFFYTFFCMMLIDRWFLAATWIFLVMVPFTAVGIIHAGVLNFKYNSRGTIVGNEDQGGDGGHGQPG